MIIALNIILILCMFVMGSLFGSFFSLATYRLPRKQDIVATRSYCPNCKHRLEFFDLIPVFSYLFRGAKCKYCSDPISPRYFILETINGILFVILYLILGYNLKLAFVVLVYAVLFVMIGSHIMKNKMTEEEKNEVKKNNLSKKSGVFISELVIALVLFVTTFVTIIYVNSNTKNKINEVVFAANANTILVKNIETCLATKYDNLSSYTSSETVDGINYNVTTKVTNVYENDDTKDDIVKQIDVKVSYSLNGKLNETTMSTLKGKI